MPHILLNILEHEECGIVDVAEISRTNLVYDHESNVGVSWEYVNDVITTKVRAPQH